MQGNGTTENPFLVATAQDLNAVRNNMSAYYRQVANIDLSNWGNWEPIGTQANPFGGDYDGLSSRFHYDGAGYSVKGLHVNQVADYAGLFGYVGYAGGIQNLSCHGVSVKAISSFGTGFAGAIAGFTLAPIKNCQSTGIVESNYNAGGIAGLAADLVELCSSGATVSITYGGAGGITGDGRNLVNCCSVGVISGRDQVGGISGKANDIDGCVFSGKATGNESVGGIAGGFQASGGKISNCYSIGEVSGTTAVGGIAGLAWGEVSCCYFSGSLNGVAIVGGLIGELSHFDDTYPSGFLLESFSLGQGIARRIGSNVDFGRCIGKSNAYSENAIKTYAQNNMQFNGVVSGFPNFSPVLFGKDGQNISLAQARTPSVYINAGWDMENTWGINAGQSFPFLRWLHRGGVFIKQDGVVRNVSRLAAKVNGELKQCKAYVKQRGQIYQI